MDIETLRHSCSHIMASAVKKLHPQAKLGIGPAIENGFYYDFDMPTAITDEDFGRIEQLMREEINKKLPFIREEWSAKQAIDFFGKNGEKYKVELINDLGQETVTVYKHGDFVDLCRGPHVAATNDIKYFKLLATSGAYWRGKEGNPQLVRIYGTVFASKEELETYLKNLEEAKARDHRKLGQDLDLYSINDEVGPGLVLWHPKGGRLRTIIENFWREQHYKNGYEIIYTPHLGRSGLWQTSGHLDFYNENMYSPIEIDEEKYYVKPMNCPFHIMIYKKHMHSYRELPLRWAELGTVYRYEKSGVLHGLLRVRGFTQDDAHLICRPDQMPQEIRNVLRFCLFMLKSFGFTGFKVYLATKPKEKYVGDDSQWQEAIAALKDAVIAENIECEVDEGGGAFYGPKIDIKIKDALNREWQCSTIQFDFNLPQRFDLYYVDSDNERKRPYMIHRALLGSLERFMGVLTEHYAGRFPFWLAPTQISLISLGQDVVEYTLKVKELLEKEAYRVDVDLSDDTIHKKIRRKEMLKIPYMLVIGKKEQETNQVAVRRRGMENLGPMSIANFIEIVNKESPDLSLKARV